MRKVKFTQDSFDEKLAQILEEFPMLDVRTRRAISLIHLNDNERSCFCIYTGPAPFPRFPHECPLRQEPLQACTWSTTDRTASHRPRRKGLCPSAQIWRQLVSMQAAQARSARAVRPFLSSMSLGASAQL